jgi:hypothetical protein
MIIRIDGRETHFMAEPPPWREERLPPGSGIVVGVVLSLPAWLLVGWLIWG